MRTNYVRCCLWMIALLLHGCGSDKEAVSDFMIQQQEQVIVEIAPLVPPTIFEPVSYKNQSLRNPFELPSVAAISHNTVTPKVCWQPEQRGERTQLEQYPISELELKGVMRRDKEISALIQMPDGLIATVINGQYIGKNYGVVLEVTSEYINIKETLPDGLGCWSHRTVKLALK